MFIILDRDGVINYDSIHYIKSPEEWHAIPGSLEAIAQLKKMNCQVVVATNQSGIARHYYSPQTLNNIHHKMQTQLKEQQGVKVDGIYYCPHHPEENCECRKPQPGLLKQIAADFMIDLKDAFVVGDRFTDIQAAKSVGAKAVLVLTGNGKGTYDAHTTELENVLVFPDLAHFAKFLHEVVDRHR